jgi:hypothetical protein
VNGILPDQPFDRIIFKYSIDGLFFQVFCGVYVYKSAFCTTKFTVSSEYRTMREQAKRENSAAGLPKR